MVKVMKIIREEVWGWWIWNNKVGCFKKVRDKCRICLVKEMIMSEVMESWLNVFGCDVFLY